MFQTLLYSLRPWQGSCQHSWSGLWCMERLCNNGSSPAKLEPGGGDAFFALGIGKHFFKLSSGTVPAAGKLPTETNTTKYQLASAFAELQRDHDILVPINPAFRKKPNPLKGHVLGTDFKRGPPRVCRIRKALEPHELGYRASPMTSPKRFPLLLKLSEHG